MRESNRQIVRGMRLLVLIGSLSLALTVQAQVVRVTPEHSRGGVKFDEPWAGIPETFRDRKIPDWPVPDDVERWNRVGQPENFRSVLYKDTGHEYLPEMRSEMVPWFERHLPVAKSG